MLHPTDDKRRSGEAKIDETDLNTDHAASQQRRSGILRRRYQRRGTTTSTTKNANNLNPEEGKADEEQPTTCNNQETTDSKGAVVPNQTQTFHPKTNNNSTSSGGSDSTTNQHAQRASLLPIMHSSYIRKKPEEKLKEKFKNRLRSVADGIPEVHFIGEVCEGIGFKDTFVSCKW